MQSVRHNMVVNNKKYAYTLEARKSGAVFLECKATHIAQEFLAEDVPNLLLDLPNLIVAEKDYNKLS